MIRVQDYFELDYRVADGIATLTLSRPRVLNAFTPRMFGELLDAFDRTDADDAVRAVVVTGSGRAFCAGADLSTGAATFATKADGGVGESTRYRDRAGRLALRILRSLKPVLAAINGPAVGVGASMTLAMDIRLASSAARIGFVFAKRGISPDGCSSWLLPRLVGMSRAQEWMLSGRIFGSDEARDSGLVRSVHEPGDLLRHAQILAQELVSGTAPVSVALTRRLLWEMLAVPNPHTAHLVESRLLAERGQSDDAAEGVTSFLQKRRPLFPMSVAHDMPDLDDWLGLGRPAES
jgi:enoyl-CoA hydratase/carnithine racemase